MDEDRSRAAHNIAYGLWRTLHEVDTDRGLRMLEEGIAEALRILTPQVEAPKTGESTRWPAPWLVLICICTALNITGCRSAKTLDAVCTSAEILLSSGVCPVNNARARPACPDGSIAYITNFDEWISHQATPAIECRFK